MKLIDPLQGMSPELRAVFDRLPGPLQRAYMLFRANRENRRGAHRDQLEAFIAGWEGRVSRRRAA